MNRRVTKQVMREDVSSILVGITVILLIVFMLVGVSMVTGGERDKTGNISLLNEKPDLEGRWKEKRRDNANEWLRRNYE